MKRIALVVPVLLLAAACGGSDKDETASGSSKAEYIAQAEAICKQVNTERAGLTFPSKVADFPKYVEDLLGLGERSADEIEALTPPAADKADLQSKVLTPLEDQITLGKAYLAKVKEAAAAHDDAKLTQLATQAPTGSKADLTWMKDYGFDECAKAANTGG